MTEFIDADTVALALSPSAVEERQRYDASTITVKFTPSALEEHTTYDSATITLTFAPSAVEAFVRYLPIFEATFINKWAATPDSKWTVPTEAAQKWNIDYFGKGLANASS